MATKEKINISDFNFALPTRIVSVLRGNVAPLFLLGAGASVKSGIPLAGEMVERIARWGYCNAFGIHQKDLNIMRTDWYRWLTKQPWYRSELLREDNYPSVIEKILQPITERKRFFLENILGGNIQPSQGYEDVCNLVSRRLISTILTTNFDNVIQVQSAKHPAIQRLEVIKTPADFTNLSTSPSSPQLVYLHGSVEHYTDQNTICETEELNHELIERLKPLLRDHPLVVVGYRGAEKSVLKKLLLDNAKKCDDFRHGIFWCIRGEANSESVHNNVVELARELKGNFHFVSIKGFDELMAEIWAHVQSTRLELSDFSTRYIAAPPVSHDLSPVKGSTSVLLDHALLRPTLIRFCEISGISAPSEPSPEWLIECARTANVLEKQGPECTIAGILLFGNQPEAHIKSAKIIVRFNGEKQWLSRVIRALEGTANHDATSFEIVISGNLWQQIDRLNEILGVINRPFRLKGAIAEDVFPYAPIALRELLTNLIVHRDYASSEIAIISISAEGIRFENPGGLVVSVQNETRGTSLQFLAQQGIRGIKGYRNPVISEFFLVTRRMEKEGTGLPDVIKEATANNNGVIFGASADNSSFCAELRIRPDHIDLATETAIPAKPGSSVLGNFLEIKSWPQLVWKTGITLTPTDLAKIVRDFSVYPLCVSGSWLWSFESISPNQSPLSRHIVDEEIHAVPTEEFLGDKSLGRGISQILSDALLLHVKSLGLIGRKEKDGSVKAYFPREGEGARSITYKGRFREATRMVAKPFVSRSSGQAIFWEHKSVALKAENSGPSWFITLLPTYSFTLDGIERPIERERIGSLTTKRAARDYNPSVRHDLAFWIWVLSGGSEEAFKLPLASKDNIEQVAIVAAALPLISTNVLEDVPDDVTAYEGMSIDEMEEVTEEIEGIISTGQADAIAD